MPNWCSTNYTINYDSEATADERKEALKVVYEHVTPQELQKEVEK